MKSENIQSRNYKSVNFTIKLSHFYKMRSSQNKMKFKILRQSPMNIETNK